ncbi:MAG: lamin tail domain-containing protein [Chloroflexi bacterium]|nr:lamin tail domain-containing protein [Chloroflexota bacterium]
MSHRWGKNYTTAITPVVFGGLFIAYLSLWGRSIPTRAAPLLQETATNTEPVPSDTPTLHSSATPSSSPSPSSTNTTFIEASATSTASTTLLIASSTHTTSPTPSPALAVQLESAAAYAPITILINEVAWSGTNASSYDEWIELHNPGVENIDLSGWILVADDDSPHVSLAGSIAPGGFYLLERSDEDTVANIPADLIYTGTLSNSGEVLRLLGPSGELVDSANLSGGNWPAGNADPRAAMMRIGVIDDNDSAWDTSTTTTIGLDANGDPIIGSPRAANGTEAVPTATPSNTLTASPTATPSSTTTPTQTHTPITTENIVVINEIAWAGTAASSNDEWIELHNPNEFTVDLTGWGLSAEDGSPEIKLSGSIPPGGYFLLERTDDTTIRDLPADLIYTGSLSNGGETLYLFNAANIRIDAVYMVNGAWPGGTTGSGSPPYASLERGDLAGTFWGSNNGSICNGSDADGNPINGTPKQNNSIAQSFQHSKTPTTTSTTTGTTTPSSTTSSTSTPTPTPTLTQTSTLTPSATATPSPTATYTATASQTPSPTATLTHYYFPAGIIRINEVAWAGTLASGYDEWIELYNPGAYVIDLTGWTLAAADEAPSIELGGRIPAQGYYLLERTDDNTISNIPADLIYTGTLSNDGETLYLRGPNGEIIDIANTDGDDWPAGDADRRTSMERFGNEDIWGSNSEVITNGRDSNGNPINGTPKYANSVWFPTQTPTNTSTPTSTPSPTPTATTVRPQRVIFNEIAWMGTIGHYNDEWIELLNPNADAINLDGWRITAADGSPDFTISGIIQPWGYFLLERTDDTTIRDIPADFIYTGSMSNSGELLYLFAPSGEIVDIVAPINGGWPAGDAALHISMERRTTTMAGISTWSHNTRFIRNGYDVDGYRVNGTPRQRNSLEFPTPTPTAIPKDALILINEFLPRARYDWNGDGRFTVSDEFIEVVNAGTIMVNLEGWLLDDLEEKFTPYEIPSIQLAPGETYAFFRSETHISLGDDGDTIYLFNSAMELVDEKQYNFAKDINISWCRANIHAPIHYPCWPTPGDTNAPYPQPDREPPASFPNTPTPAFPPDGQLIPKGLRILGYT